MGASRKRTNSGKGPSAREVEEWKVLFPYETYEAQTGIKVQVRQWNIEQGAELIPAVMDVGDKLRQRGATGEVEPKDLFQYAAQELVEIVGTTLGWTSGELNERLTMDDLFNLVEIIWKQNIVREDGGGLLPKVAGLAGALGGLAGLVPGASPQPERSTTSSEPATDSATSED